MKKSKITLMRNLFPLIRIILLIGKSRKSSEEKNVNKESGDLLSANELKGSVLFFGLQEKI
jgi:uncharacterized lipoprotein YajG